MADISTKDTARSDGLAQVWTSVKNVGRSQGALIAFVILAIFGSIRYDGFLSQGNIYSFLSYNAMFAMIALGMTFVIMTGGIDLSVGSVVALSSVVAAKFSPQGLLPAMLACVLTGLAVGLFNGVVIAYLKVPPFIATLVMLLAARGFAFILANDASIIVDTSSDYITIWTNTLLHIPIPIYFLLIVYIIGAFIHYFTRFGRHVLAVGGNEDAARLMGLSVERIKLSVYVISGILAGLAGVLLAAQTYTGAPTAGSGWELTAIASVVVGGTLLSGGKGSVLTTLVGALLLGLIFNILNFENGYGVISLNAYWQTVIRGAFLLVVVLLQSRLVQRKGKLI